MAVEQLWDYLVDPFTNLMGDYFFPFIMLLTVAVIWMWTKSMGPPLVVLMIASAAMWQLLEPPTSGIMFLFMCFGVTIMIFRLVVKWKTMG